LQASVADAGGVESIDVADAEVVMGNIAEAVVALTDDVDMDRNLQ